MKEIKDGASSVLVVIVTSKGDEDVALEAFRNGSVHRLKSPGTKNFLPQSDAPALPGRPQPSVSLSQSHKIQQALHFINDHYETGIRLSDVAGKAGMSPAHFSRLFKRVMGLPYQEYLNGRRITKAKSLLRTSPRSIAEIAALLGFADATGFGRTFKKLTGQTPSAYRRLPGE